MCPGSCSLDHFLFITDHILIKNRYFTPRTRMMQISPLCTKRVSASRLLTIDWCPRPACVQNCKNTWYLTWEELWDTAQLLQPGLRLKFPVMDSSKVFDKVSHRYLVEWNCNYIASEEIRMSGKRLLCGSEAAIKPSWSCWLRGTGLGTGSRVGHPARQSTQSTLFLPLYINDLPRSVISNSSVHLFMDDCVRYQSVKKRCRLYQATGISAPPWTRWGQSVHADQPNKYIKKPSTRSISDKKKLVLDWRTPMTMTKHQ